MQIAVIGDPLQGREWKGDDINWLSSPADLHGYDAVIDLLFDGEAARVQQLKQSGAKLIVINSVVHTLTETDRGFVRINAWPGFADNITEAAVLEEDLKKPAEELFTSFHKSVEWLPDQPGFVTPRVVAMIINEAYIALGDGVSTREDINTAMKTGTNYPFGPFEWATQIGLKNIAALLWKLAEKNERYTPSKLLTAEAAL